MASSQMFFADDKFGDVIEVLQDRGWTLNTTPDQFAHLTWRNLSNTPFVKCNETTYVNHLEGAQYLSNKGKFTRLLAFNDNGRGESCLPRVHALDPPPRTVKKSLSGEAKLTLSIEALLRDLITQLAIGVLQNILLESTSESSKPIYYKVEVVAACIGICERWVRQLRDMFATNALHQQPNGATIKRPCAPSRDVVIVGGAIWDLIVAHGYSVPDIMVSIKQTDNGCIVQPLSSELMGGMQSALGQLRLVDTHYELGGAGIWIVKPSGLSCGQGIRCLDSILDIAEACARLEFKAVVQKYIERPLLLCGRKFDIRLWVLITSVSPLVVWSFSDCYLRFSSKPFNLNNLDDKLVHLCNYSIQRTEAAGLIDLNPIHERSSTEFRIEENMASSRAFSAFVEQNYGEGSWFQLLHKMRIAVLSSLNACKVHLTKKGLGFEWIGFDLMIAEEAGKLRPYIIEANTSPDVSHSTTTTAALVPLATRDIFNLLIDEGHAQVDGGSLDNSAKERESCLLKHNASETLCHTSCFPKEACWQLWYKETETSMEEHQRSSIALSLDVDRFVGMPEDRSILPPRNFADLCRCLPQLKA